MNEPVVADIARVIQLAVAPVFLLLAVGSVLGILTSRLARIIDRGRILAAKAEAPDVRHELDVLGRRARLINFGITMGVTTALFVGAVIVTLFFGELTATPLGYVVAVEFSLAMVAFIAALLAFLREIFLATGTLHFGKR